ncbi:carboxymuconolactone decarboxylase family protein [Candidatus Poriferisodalis sp.]|uniref:carboxymuconolactone decarboxylase family protein n=1 Tax=Candidatus Poriferisodalis sp. TaxID=3101277 RepID=UPI003B023223
MDDELYGAVDRYSEIDEFSEREKLAIEFGERFALDHTSIDDEFWARLSERFSERELLELTVTAGFCTGIGRALQVLDVAVDFDVLWSREPAHAP